MGGSAGSSVPDREGDDGGDDHPPARAALARLQRWGGEALVREMTGLFLADMPRRLAAWRAALAAGDGDGVARPAHAMKSSSAQLGASALERLCAATESTAARGELSGAAHLLDAMERELARFSAWLRGEAGDVGGSAGPGVAP